MYKKRYIEIDPTQITTDNKIKIKITPEFEKFKKEWDAICQAIKNKRKTDSVKGRISKIWHQIASRLQ